MSRFHVTLFSLLLVTTTYGWGQLDTLRNYRVRGGVAYYSDPAIAVQAARFDLGIPATLRAVTVHFGGNSREGSAFIHIYGAEGGMAAPMVEEDLVSPRRVKKTRGGPESFRIAFDRPIEVGGSQFFVAVDHLSPGMVLLSDRQAKPPVCVANGEAYTNQLIRNRDNTWRWGKYGYRIDVEVEYTTAKPRATFADVSADAGLADTPIVNHSLAWADYNDDGYLDLLAGGHLFRNSGSSGFTDVTAKAGLTGVPLLNCFIDIDNDGRQDILFLGAFSGTPENRAFLNAGDGTFRQQSVDIPPLTNPTSFSIADANADGLPDIFVGQSATNGVDTTSLGMLLINEGSLRFRIDSLGGAMLDDRHRQSNGSQWVDYNNDGWIDLYVGTVGSAQGDIWLNDGQGGFHLIRVAPRLLDVAHTPTVAGGSWADYDNDGDADLLLPRQAHPREVGQSAEGQMSAILMNQGELPHASEFGSGGEVSLGFVRQQAGGAWGDFNNDGKLDLLLATDCSCSFVDLFSQSETGTFEKVTYENGLFRTAFGPDAIWVDYDNDGRLDICAIRDARLHLFQNQGSFAGANFVEIELDGSRYQMPNIGSRVTVYAGGKRYMREVTSGRGLLMQDPDRLHFGIGSATSVDSVTVAWRPGSTPVAYHTVAVNTLTTLEPGRPDATQPRRTLPLAVFPNPFSSELQFQYELIGRGSVRIEIYSPDGQLVSVPVSEVVEAGRHVAVWRAIDAQGRRLSQGAYVYRFITSEGEVVGKAILQN